jgi:hypothetical protein
MFSTRKVSPQWQSDSILNSQLQSPSFSRTNWDKSKAHKFGPWGLDAKSNPTDVINDESPENSKENSNSDDLKDSSAPEEELSSPSEISHKIVLQPHALIFAFGNIGNCKQTIIEKVREKESLADQARCAS